MDILNIVGREKELFHTDIAQNEKNILNLVKKSKFLVIGGAGSIGKAVSLEIYCSTEEGKPSSFGGAS